MTDITNELINTREKKSQVIGWPGTGSVVKILNLLIQGKEQKFLPNKLVGINPF